MQKRIESGRRRACTLASAALLIALAATVTAQETRPTTRSSALRPHIVFIMADDLGVGDLGFLGSDIQTPEIDRLAARGVWLDRFYTEPLCTPTRAALLTGRYPFRYGLQTLIRPWSTHGLPPEERTIAEALRGAGYATHIVGKWHVGHARREYLPTEQGFDHHYGLYLMSVDYFTHANGGGLDWHRDARPVKEKGYATDLLAAEAVRIIREHPADKPLFLYVPFSAPHSPLQATQEYVARYESIEDESRRIYAAMVTCLDAGVGRIVRAIEERGFERNTLIVFCSDNGASLSYGGSNAMLSGRKGSTFEGGVRAPAIVVWPGQLEAGRRITEPIHVIDWYPTLVSLAGGSLDQPRPLDGVDLWPLLSQKTPLPPRDLILKATRRGGTILRGEWKLMVTSGNGAGRLFNLEDDPLEQRDVREAHADLAAELRAALVPYQRAVVGNPQSGKRPTRFETPAVWGADHGYERKKTIPPRRERKHGKDD